MGYILNWIYMTSSSQLSRGKFAILCVEMDLNKPLLEHFILRESNFREEYEGLYTLCFTCGRFRHVNENRRDRLIFNDGEKENNGSSGDVSVNQCDGMYDLWTMVNNNRRKKGMSMVVKRVTVLFLSEMKVDQDFLLWNDLWRMVNNLC